MSKAYSIPKDNPFVGTAGARPEIWAYGFRNPWRLAFDRKSGQLWVGQNGQDSYESVYLVHRGDNYGWSIYEGGHPFYPQRKRGPNPITFPIIDHPHSGNEIADGRGGVSRIEVAGAGWSVCIWGLVDGTDLGGESAWR